MRICFFCLLFFLIISGCSASPTELHADTTSVFTLELFQTSTATASPTSAGPATTTPLPPPTLTPRSYAIRRGDTFSDIALNFGVSIASLRTANPDVDTNFLIVGTVLAVPPAEPAIYGTPEIPSPTPANLDFSQPYCSRSAEGGIWCFVNVTNNLHSPVENVLITLLLANAETGEVLQQYAITPLNLLPVGISQPAYAFFPPPAPTLYEIQAQLTTAMLVPDANTRYLGVTIENRTTTISLDGSNAQITGEIVLTDPASQPSLIWVSATAYDFQNRIVGVRRWESENLTSDINFFVYATVGEIYRVELLAEARP